MSEPDQDLLNDLANRGWAPAEARTVASLVAFIALGLDQIPADRLADEPATGFAPGDGDRR